MSTITASQALSTQASLISAATGRAAPIRNAEQKTGTWPCLVLSSIGQHRDMFQAAAAGSGWDAHICSDSVTALKLLCRRNFKLVIVDLEGAEDADASYRSLAEHIQWIGSTLLVVNSRPDDQSAELWARQLGAWSYLPGLQVEADLSELYKHALTTAEKLHAPRR